MFSRCFSCMEKERVEDLRRVEDMLKIGLPSADEPKDPLEGDVVPGEGSQAPGTQGLSAAPGVGAEFSTPGLGGTKFGVWCAGPLAIAWTGCQTRVPSVD